MAQTQSENPFAFKAYDPSLKRENTIQYMPPAARKQIKDYLSATSIWQPKGDANSGPAGTKSAASHDYKSHREHLKDPQSVDDRTERFVIQQKNTKTNVYFGKNEFHGNNANSEQQQNRTVSVGMNMKELRAQQKASHFAIGNSWHSDKHQIDQFANSFSASQDQYQNATASVKQQRAEVAQRNKVSKIPLGGQGSYKPMALSGEYSRNQQATLNDMSPTPNSQFNTNEGVEHYKELARKSNLQQQLRQNEQAYQPTSEYRSGNVQTSTSVQEQVQAMKDTTDKNRSSSLTKANFGGGGMANQYAKPTPYNNANAYDQYSAQKAFATNIRNNMAKPNIELQSAGSGDKKQSVSNSLHTFNADNVKDLTAHFPNRNIKQSDVITHKSPYERITGTNSYYMNTKSSAIDSQLIQENKDKILSYRERMLTNEPQVPYGAQGPKSSVQSSAFVPMTGKQVSHVKAGTLNEYSVNNSVNRGHSVQISMHQNEGKADQSDHISKLNAARMEKNFKHQLETVSVPLAKNWEGNMTGASKNNLDKVADKLASPASQNPKSSYNNNANWMFGPVPMGGEKKSGTTVSSSEKLFGGKATQEKGMVQSQARDSYQWVVPKYKM